MRRSRLRDIVVSVASHVGGGDVRLIMARAMESFGIAQRVLGLVVIEQHGE